MENNKSFKEKLKEKLEYAKRKGILKKVVGGVVGLALGASILTGGHFIAKEIKNDYAQKVEVVVPGDGEIVNPGDGEIVNPGDGGEVVDLGEYMPTAEERLEKDVTIPYGYSSIEDYAFSYCSNLESVSIPDSVKSIGEGAFSGCSKLKSVKIPTHLIREEGWKEKIFGNNIPKYINFVYEPTAEEKLEKHITIPEGYTSIENYTFSYCLNLESVSIPDSVKSIGKGAFYRCSSLKEFNVSPTNKMYKTEEYKRCLIDKEGKLVAFAPSGLENYVIPDSVKSIEEDAFYGCSSLKSITIPDSVTSIGWRAFSDFFSLRSITIPDSVTSIRDDAFHRCSSLKEFNVSPSNKMYKTTEDKRCLLDKDGKLIAFAPAELKTYVIPDGVTSIGWHAFTECSSLKTITIPDSVAAIGESAFSGCSSLESITIPDGVTSIGWGAFYGCSSLKEFNVSPTNKMYKTEEYKRCLIDKEGKLVAFAPSGLENYVIPDSVKSIEEDAFDGCSSLETITIPDGVTSIGDRAFNECSSLQSITIPNSVKTIGWHAFSGCSGLESVKIPKHLTEKEGWEKRIFGEFVPENIEIYDNTQVKTDEGLSK